MCSYWRARFVPFFTPRGGTVAASFRSIGDGRTAMARGRNATTGAFELATRVESPGEFKRSERRSRMYIGGGLLALIIIVVLLVWLF
jgi:hypothetical protein